ncbi:MAG: lysophospholipid acyltransferase family protein [Cytophagales bacterium]|nr:lysophospholipid acyltransferase family protein [Cytophagales bacterium]
MIVTIGNLYYYPLKLYVFIASYLYFRKLRIVGRKNIPVKGPLIYAINHQNALLDALLLSVVSRRNPHFLTRADVFKNRFADKFLRGLKMLPIYRIRDGFDSVKMNEAIFDAAKDILVKGGVVGIFPEGSHSLKYMMRPLKKGVARIAFRAEEAVDFNLDLKIVPVGIQYESHFYPRGRTLISFGKPVRVSDYLEAFHQNQSAGIEQLLDELYKRMKSLILHFTDTPEYANNLEIFRKKRAYKRDLQKQLSVDQELVCSIESGYTYNERSDKKNLLCLTLENSWQFLWKIIGFLPKSLVDYLLKRTTKDPHFFATMKFGYSIFLYPLTILFLYFLIKHLVF